MPRRQNITLLERLSDPKVRLWYAEQTIRHGWSQPILALQIAGRAHERQGKAVSNFKDTLPPADSDLASQVFKDPYLFDFLGTADPRREREVEQAPLDHVQRFLLELGAGFAFVELKATPFRPGDVGQINLYLSAVDDLLRHPDDKPSVGLLLCRSRNKLVAEYALRGLKKPIGVAEWEIKIVASLPADLKDGLPTVKEIEAELAGEPLSSSDKGEARALRVSRSTIYDHLRKDPTLGLLSRVSDEDFRRQLQECNGDLHLLAKRLRVSFRAVQLRFSKS